MRPDLLIVTGPTATGKTALAVALARELGGEIISADSRQVFRGMDIGTGKDLAEYGEVPHHLVDILEPGQKYSVYQFQRDFWEAYRSITSRGRVAVLCGGTGLYVEAVARGYRLPDVPADPALRARLQGKSLAELAATLAALRPLHNTTDLDTPARAIRAIEIAAAQAARPGPAAGYPPLRCLLLGPWFERGRLRERITRRLGERMAQGLVDEARRLVDAGVGYDTLISYGLEYKYAAWRLMGRMDDSEMFRQLNTAIHQFAKRQVTWFRRMERQGAPVRWIDGELPASDKLQAALELWRRGV